MPSREPELQLEFTDSELSAVFQPSADAAAIPTPAPAEDLILISRRLSGQYIDLLATFVQDAFARKAPGSTAPILGMIESLLRLSRATRDQDMRDRLQALHDTLSEGVPDRPRAHQQFLKRLRAGILDIAPLLESADSDRLKQLILYDRGSVPLLEELGKIKGIGPRRMERLYCAGLVTIAQITRATAEELSQVTDIPQGLAEEVIAVSHDFSARQRRECVEGLSSQVAVFAQTAPQLDRDRDQALLEAAHAALRQLQTLLSKLAPPEENSP